MNQLYKHEYLTVNIPINYLEDAPSLLNTSLNEWWNNSYLSDLEPNENIPFIVQQWLDKHINTEITKEAIQKIRDANPPKEITIKLVIELLTSDNFLKLEDEISEVPMFRPYITTPNKYTFPYELYRDPESFPLPTEEFSLDTYIYNPNTKHFESLEIIDQETLIEEKVPIEVINEFYSFHQRLLEASSKKLKLYTSQPEERINQWNKQGFIPKNAYLTDSLQRAEYYFNQQENDIIVYYRVPENQLIMTSDAFGAKEYVTLNNVKIE